jgi:hypothetical protein
MTRSTAETVSTNDAGPPPRNPDTVGTAWGACQIRLVADRVPSLRAGSTHKVYRDWRFAAVMQHGYPQAGSTVFTVRVDPLRLATSRSRYALVQLTTPGEMAAGRPIAFSWSASAIGTADPFAEAQARAQRRLEATGWTPEAVVPSRFAKSGPNVPIGAAAQSSPARSAHADVPGGDIEADAFQPPYPRTATPPLEITGLDGWEMDGGA